MDDSLATIEQGTGRVERRSNGARLLRLPTTDHDYANAQIGDRPGVLRRQPALRLTLRARFSQPVAQLRGTAGFGFWNAALGPGIKTIRPPRTAWFFLGGPPHDVPLALDVPGHGFKAAVLDARRLSFYALLPTAPVGVLLMRIPWMYRRLWPIAQRAIGASEICLDAVDVTTFHAYAIDWRVDRLTFAIDDQVVLVAPSSPPGPLSFVAWIDNSYAIATPRGRLALGLVEISETQWLEVEQIQIREG